MADLFMMIGIIATVFGALRLLGGWMVTQPERRQGAVWEWFGRVGLTMLALGVASVVLPSIF